jgi:hypothetical protein
MVSFSARAALDIDRRIMNSRQGEASLANLMRCARFVRIPGLWWS